MLRSIGQPRLKPHRRCSRYDVPTVRSVLFLCFTMLTACGSKTPTEPRSPDPVSQVPARISIEPSSLAFDSIGLTQKLAAVVYDADNRPVTSAVVSWSSSDQKVVRVTRGIVVSVGVGSATVTAEIGNISASAPVDVMQEIFSIHIVPSAVSIPLSRPSYSIKAFCYDRNRNIVPNPVVMWTSSETAVATVDEDGVVTPVARGSTLITVTAGNVTATLPLSVH